MKPAQYFLLVLGCLGLGATFAQNPTSMVAKPTTSSAPVAAATAPGTRPTDPSDDARIQGRWTFKRIDEDGKEKLPRYNDGQIAFKGGICVNELDGHPMDKMNYVLRQDASPKEIDFRIPGEPAGNPPERGIYALEGDTLKLCTGEGDTRPKEFKTDNHQLLMILTRVK